MRLKLNLAATLLLTTSRPVHKIAEQVGFEDPYHFSRNFKKFHGFSPRNYRLAHI
jgi:transcriptional regulator GlxA family with amidase domain